MTDPAAQAAQAEPLFRGAARLGVLLGALELPWEQVAPLIAAFPGELRDGLSLGLSTGQPPLWLSTGAEGQAATFRIARFMEERGVAEPDLRRLLVTAAHFGHRRLLFEPGVDATGLHRFAWLLRQPADLAVTRAWVEAAGCPVETLARLEGVATALQKPHAHALGEEVGPAAPRTLLVAFSQESDARAWPRMEQAARRAGLDEAAWAQVEALMPALIGRPSRFVLELRAGEVAALRLEVEEVDRACVEEAVEGAALAPTFRERLRLLTDLAGRPRLDRVTFRLAPGAPLQVTAWSSTATLDA